MSRTTLVLASLLAIWVSPAFAQVIVTARPVVTYYPPAAPVVTYHAPAMTASTVVASPVVTYSVPVVVNRPVTTYYAPAVTAAPVSTYYAPATSYVAPTTAYYAPVTAYYGGPVVAPVYGRPVTVGRTLYGTLTPYVPGQPVRNALRFSLP